MKETIFISHATPEDNQFVLWLSSRLNMMGYKVWCDLEGLIGGEKDFWARIDDQIRNQSCKFVFVVSRYSFLKDGVIKEFEFAESIAKEHSITDFVIPIRLEAVPYNIRIGLNTYNVIDFASNWETGLKQLVTKLEVDSTPKALATTESERVFDKLVVPYHSSVTSKRERYFTNWWPIKKLPEILYLHHYENLAQAKAVLALIQNDYPIIRHGNILASFVKDLPTEIPNISLQLDILEGVTNVRPNRLYEVQVSEILVGFEATEFPQQRDAENLLKRVLMRAFHLMMKKKGLSWFEMSNKRNSYFYRKNHLYHDKVAVKYNKSRVKKKNVVGKFRDGIWHFGVSAQVQLQPILAFNLKSHILFSSDGNHIWDSSAKLHSARRKKGRTWFNEHWRDQLFAFIAGLGVGCEEILVDLKEDFALKMPLFTQSYISEHGYVEPETNDRQDIMIGEDEFEDELESIEATAIPNEQQ